MSALSHEPQKETLLCLVCRKGGHLAWGCLEYPENELDWFISETREQMEFYTAGDSSGALCQRCRALDLLTWLDEDLSIENDTDLDDLLDDPLLFRDLGKVGSVVLRSDCALCRCLFGLIPNPSALDQDVKLVRTILDPSATGLAVADLVSTRGDGLSLAQSDLGYSTLGLSAWKVDPHHINVGAILNWLSICERNHPKTCVQERHENLHTICLIDAISRTIVPFFDITQEYFALSYVWGGVAQHLLGAGKPGTMLGKLPQTIEDALILVKNLGKQYLWVDSICIDQENKAQKLQQISIMSEIYQGAYATIIAFSGSSANVGLPRIGSTKTSYRQLECAIDGIRLLGFGPTLSQLVWVLPWGDRAWTFQEALLSPRCIYVSKYHVIFECNSMTCCESIDESLSCIHQAKHDEAFFKSQNYIQQINTGVLRSPLSANVTLKDNELRTYSIYATLFCYRSLTRQSDALFAFSGILQALERTAYRDGFFWALPHADLNWALLWEGRNLSESNPVPRRAGFPLWSWLSWQGRIWPGQPQSTGQQFPHRYTFDIKMWKRQSDGGRQKIFESSYNDMGTQDQQQLSNDPLSDLADLEPGDDNFESSGNLSVAEQERLLYVESFVLSFSPRTWKESQNDADSEHVYFRMQLNGSNLRIQVIRGQELLDIQRTCTFLLLARNIIDDESGRWITHHLLLLDPRHAYFERNCVVRLGVRSEELHILGSMDLRRRRVILV